MNKSGKYQISFYDSNRKRALLLHSWNYLHSIETVIGQYGLSRISFINVFECGQFKHRHYVRNGKLVPFVGREYDLSKDDNLKKKLVSDRPVTGKITQAMLDLIAGKKPPSLTLIIFALLFIAFHFTTPTMDLVIRS
jgi:hypothetical protein